MTDQSKNLFGLSSEHKQRLIDKMRSRMRPQANDARLNNPEFRVVYPDVQKDFYSVEELPGLKQLKIQATAADKFGIRNPFFMCHQGVAGNTTMIDGKTLINYSSYNYLGLNGHPRVSQAAKAAIDRYGTSASASRPVSGERPIHRELEQALDADRRELPVAQAHPYGRPGRPAAAPPVGHPYGEPALLHHGHVPQKPVGLGDRDRSGREDRP